MVFTGADHDQDPEAFRFLPFQSGIYCIFLAISLTLSLVSCFSTPWPESAWVILHSGFQGKQEKILQDSELPTVFLDREIQTKYVSSVVFDSYQTGRRAAEYLFSLGHRRLMLA